MRATYLKPSSVATRQDSRTGRPNYKRNAMQHSYKLLKSNPWVEEYLKDTLAVAASNAKLIIIKAQRAIYRAAAR